MNVNDRDEERFRGRWTPEEHALFKMAYHTYGKDWKKLSNIIRSRSVYQIRSHAQKYCKKISVMNDDKSEKQKVFVRETAYETLKNYVSDVFSIREKWKIRLQQDLAYNQQMFKREEVEYSSLPVKNVLRFSSSD